VDEVSAALIATALRALDQRYLFTAQNIANANTPQYRPVRVSFEDALRDASARGVDAINAVEPRIYVEDAGENNEAMRLDLELATASQTAARYSALVDILGRQMALHRAMLAAGGRS
jgi:flagellar basal-body rod protein FlgB